MDIICIFAKPPIPGKTKSRLAKDIGFEAAAELSKAMLIDLCFECLQSKAHQVELWYPPDSSPKDFLSFLPSSIVFKKQMGADLGQRMSYVFENGLKKDDRIVIIGSDCISHTMGHFDHVFETFESFDVLVQPADDGGYVLVGQKGYCPSMFEDIDWGSNKVMAQTREKLVLCDISSVELESSFDIDEVGDLDKLKNGVFGKKEVARWLKKYSKL